MIPPSLRLHNTLTGTVQEFRPHGNVVSLYVCGVTPYDTAHLGHGFTYAQFDVLIRYLRHLGYPVRYVQNVTDIDDPLFAKAKQLGVSYVDLAREETERYLRDMEALNVLPAEVYPHASREIPRMIEIVRQLEDRGHVYTVDGFTYFRTATDAEYGKLSKLDRQAMLALARERGGNPDAPRRDDPLDFVLWRPSGEGEPSLHSPWGDGLPGWHLECSAMSLGYLGAPIDIHGGGADLIFPHHENEIAQSEGATGDAPFARFWMHTGMVYLGGEKMSKSLGNMVFVRDLIAEHGANAVRLYISGTHYRDELQYDPAGMMAAAEVGGQLALALSLPGGSAVSTIDGDAYRILFLERMSDDLDTPGAIAVLRELAAAIESSATAGEDVSASGVLLRELGDILGLRL